MAIIYTITHIASGRCYVGHTSGTFKKRVSSHRYDLDRRKHRNAKLQNAWTKYGADAFIFAVLEECHEKQKLKREQHYIDILGPFYNIALVAGSRKGVPQPPHVGEAVRLASLGRKHTRKVRKLIGQASKAWWSVNDQTPAQRENTLKSLELGRAKSPANKPGWIPTHRIGAKDTVRTIKKRIASKRAFHAEQRAAGIRNWWITDGESEQMILSFEPIPEGWRRGRQPKIGEIGRSRVGEKRSDATRKKMSKAHKGVALSEAHRAAQKRGWIERRQEN